MADSVPFEALCPTTGQICETRQKAITLYLGDMRSVEGMHLGQSSQSSDSESLRPELNGYKLNGLLQDHTKRALQADCRGLIDGDCPVPIIENRNRTGKFTLKHLLRR